MKLINLLSGKMPFGPCVVGLGTFDGVHVGHSALIAALIGRARELSLPAVIFTFDHSPKRILSPEKFPGEITMPEEKFKLLLNSGVDWVVFRAFDAEFAETNPIDFLEKVVVGVLQSRAVFVGFNFGFGLKRAGDARVLCSELGKLEVECHVLSPVTHEGQTVSSTVIRTLILEGNFDLANKLLGREVVFSGEVIHGDHRGRKMGFPTANLDLEKSLKVIPPNGVYFCRVDTPLGGFFSITNVGTRPTFDKTQRILEAHLIDFQGDLYYKTIRVSFLRRIRNESRFPNMEALVSQIQADMNQARDLMKAFSKTVHEEKKVR